MSRNTKSIGVAFEDQYLKDAELEDCTLIDPTQSGTSTVETLRVTGSAQLGNAASDTLGFFGQTVTTQPTVIASVTTTGATSTTNAYGYTTAAQADAIVTAVNAAVAALKSLGLVASA